MGHPITVGLHRERMEGAARSFENPAPIPGGDESEGNRRRILDGSQGTRGGQLVLLPTLLLALNEGRIAGLALQRRLPTIFWRSEFAEAGGLMAYGPDHVYSLQRAGALVARILKGARPADLPVEKADRFRLVINLKTAKALGLTIPQTLLLRADQIIE